MKDPDTPMIAVAEALQIVLREARPLALELVRLESASGRILAEEVLADADQPPFAKAMMDGFAVRSEDVREVPAELEVIDEIPAGKMPSRRLERGQAARIMTGAPIPEGADAVQMVEKTEKLRGGDGVRILQSVSAGTNVAPRAREIQAGQQLLSPGDRLTPSRIGILSGVGRAQVSVRRRPRVVVAPTGDELVSSAAVPAPGQIRNTNGPALAAAARLLGAEVEELPPVRDDPAELAACLRAGLRADLLLLSGGVSMGEYDLVEQELERAGVEVFFRKIAIRPGKPAVFGRRGDCLVFGLPGNPVSSLVIFQVLVAAALRRMLGAPQAEGVILEARLEGEIRQHPGRTAYLPGRLGCAGGSIAVRPIPTTGSADLLAHSLADALMIVPADRERMSDGERITVLLIGAAGEIVPFR